MCLPTPRVLFENLWKQAKWSKIIKDDQTWQHWTAHYGAWGVSKSQDDVTHGYPRCILQAVELRGKLGRFKWSSPRCWAWLPRRWHVAWARCHRDEGGVTLASSKRSKSTVELRDKHGYAPWKMERRYSGLEMVGCKKGRWLAYSN